MFSSDKPSNTKKTIICDIDGTVAIIHNRGFFDWELVGNDLPNYPVIEHIRAFYSQGYEIVFVSGRMDYSFTETVKWLKQHVIFDFELYMRLREDYRPDTEVKKEIFEKELVNRNIAWVYDDRNSVVKMWRSLGLTVLQVADGDF